MDKKRIVFVSHCIINTASKVVKHDEVLCTSEEAVRKKFLLEAVEKNIHFIQLPCPEFTLYGAKRWGHVKEQFDNPFFRDHCKEILAPIIQQMREYCRQTDKFEVLGIIGINGSPSCGVTYTCKGQWGGEFSSCKDIEAMLRTIRGDNDRGIMIEVLEEMISEAGIKIKILGLTPQDPHEIFDLIGVENEYKIRECIETV